MTKRPEAYIISIGDEILIGQIVNTNASWMAEALNQIGIKVPEVRTIADTQEAIRNTLDHLIGKYPIILMTGGLGPTKDDVTKTTLEAYFGGGWREDAEVLMQLEHFFKERNRSLNEANRGQALLPKACKTLLNRMGTAAGMWFEKDNTIVVSMPGVPYEMKHIMETGVIPELKTRFSLPPLLHRTFHTEGIPESELMGIIRAWEEALPQEISLAYLPSAGRVKLRLSCLNQDGTGQQLMEQAEHHLREVLGGEIFGTDKERLEEVVVRLMIEKEYTLATAESCTGGLLAQRITSVPGASAAFLGGMVSYDNSIKIRQLGVPPAYIQQFGAVSKEVVESMAEGARSITGADYALSSSGVAGPGGGTPEKPVGMVWIGLASPEGTYSKCFRFGSTREGNVLRATQSALNLLRKHLIGMPWTENFWENTP